MWIGLVTLFPEMFRAIAEQGVIGRGIDQGLIEVAFWNPRDFTTDRHRTVDDKPYGGGPGMLMQVEPVRRAIGAAKAVQPAARVVHLTPQGRRLDHRGVRELAVRAPLILVCGRYEGIDERVIDAYVDEEVSIGDYVVSGGELPAMVLMDALSRHVPGVLGDADSAHGDSFAAGLLDFPHYTRPPVVDGGDVPAVLMSGDHAAIARWRQKQALGRTWQRRPDLLASRLLDVDERALLAEYIDELMKLEE